MLNSASKYSDHKYIHNCYDDEVVQETLHIKKGNMKVMPVSAPLVRFFLLKCCFTTNLMMLEWDVLIIIL